MEDLENLFHWESPSENKKKSFKNEFLALNIRWQFIMALQIALGALLLSNAVQLAFEGNFTAAFWCVESVFFYGLFILSERSRQKSVDICRNAISKLKIMGLIKVEGDNLRALYR